MWELLEANLIPLLALGLTALFGWFIRKGWLKKETAEELKLDVQGAVTSVYHEYVKARKAGAEDGKLTDEEKKEARNLALAKLKEVGKDKGIDYAKKYGVPLILGLVEKYVSSNKKEKKEE